MCLQSLNSSEGITVLGAEFPPVAYALWVPILGVTMIVLAVAGAYLLLRRPSAASPPSVVSVAATSAGRDYLSEFESLHEALGRGELAEREFHLALAELARAYGSERTGHVMAAMTRAEAARYLPGTKLATLISACEFPSFGQWPRPDTAATSALAREVFAE